MGGFSEFARVIEQKIRRDLKAELQAEDLVSRGENPNFTREYDDSPRGMAWLIGKTPRATIIDPRGKTAYGVKERPLPPHKLNVFQMSAVRFFLDHGVSLSPRFSKKELKAAFRKLALRLHPDQGGAAQSFMELKSCFELLTDLNKA